MERRWSLVVLILLGIAAAASAAVLTASMRAEPKQAIELMPARDMRILVAARDLSALSVINSASVEEKAVSKDAAPEDSYTDPAQIIGKMLTVPVVQGQALTRSVFPTEGSGLQLAGVLPDGMRAVSVSLSDHSGLEGLLYPGCKVDIVATFKMNNESHLGDGVATTLLENIEVLAVERQTVGSPKNEKDEDSGRSKVARAPLVTLRVDAKQAEAIELAMQYGVISLAMRNPKDNAPGEAQGTVLSEGRLAELAKFLPTTVKNVPEPSPPKESPPPPPPAREPERHATPAPAPEYTVDVIRGVDVETLSFSSPNIHKSRKIGRSASNESSKSHAVGVE